MKPQRTASTSDEGDVRADAPLTLAFPNDFPSLAAARERVRRHLAALGVDERAVYAVDLVLEELAGNALRHGYDQGERGEIRVVLSMTPAEVLVGITDDARAFDPTLHPEPSPARTLQDAPSGGRGISMVRNSVRAMRYRREAGRNRLDIEVARAMDPG